MAVFNNHAGLNITNSKLQIVEVKFDNRKVNLENVEEVYFEGFLDESSKETKFIDVLQTALNEIALKIDLTSRKLSFTLSSDFFKFFEFPLDRTLQKGDFDEHLHWEFSKLYPHLIPSDYLLRSISMITNKVFGLALRRSLPRSLHKFCLKNDFLFNKVDYSHIAVSNLIHKLVGGGQTASLCMEEASMSLILRKNDSFEYSIVKKYNTSSQLPSILTSILEHAKSRGIEFSEYDPLFVNGNSLSEEVIGQIEQKFSSQIEKFNPFEYLEIPFNLRDSELVNSKYYSFAAPTGIALRID